MLCLNTNKRFNIQAYFLEIEFLVGKFKVPVNVDLDQSLGDEPSGVSHGKLNNGLSYYVRSNSKPRMQAALAFAVKAGSVLEEEDERGVAHIVDSQKNLLRLFSILLCLTHIFQVARVRLQGFSEREVSIVRSQFLAEIKSAYLERDQMQSTSLRDEYLQHFLRDEPVIGIEYEAQLQKTVLPNISASDLSLYAEKLQTSCSCVIKTIEPRASAVADDLKNIVMKINSLEKENNIPHGTKTKFQKKLLV